MAAVLPLDAGGVGAPARATAATPRRPRGFAFGKYREIIIAVAFFLLFDLGVLVLNFYTSFKIDQEPGRRARDLGAGLEISVPVKLQGASGVRARVRKHPYVITLRWNRQPALVCVDMEKTR